ncbi:MAG: class I adenylate-forming enzyme family protein [Chloroflexota bacterium]
MAEQGVGLYELSTGEPIISLVEFKSPVDEYRSAFEDGSQPFLNYYTFEGKDIQRRSLTRGEFWDLGRRAAACLREHGLSRGDRVVHGFSDNSLYDMAFRLGSALVGCVPVTINWQADDDERIIYKAEVTGARLLVYDEEFTGHKDAIEHSLPAVRFLKDTEVEGFPPDDTLAPPLSYDDERYIIFTSGTTGRPKGVSLPHRAYLANRLTFERYLGMSRDTRLDLLLVNPLHHANSSALADWGLRRPGAIIHLVQRYGTLYWKVLAEVAGKKRDVLFAPLVSRHIDLLESLHAQQKLPVAEAELREALGKTVVALGSAPVGPTTVRNVIEFSGHLPHVRYGSTETCLHVVGTPVEFSEDERMEAFRAGWAHRSQAQGEEQSGYYIGRECYPFTRVKVVRAIEPDSPDYFAPCDIAEPGYLIAQGANVMSHYVGEAEATEAAFREGWYIGLRDIAFTLKNKKDGQLDYYWMSRDSALLIKGGANYAYDQVAAELSRVLAEDFGLKPDQFKLAVVGIRWHSEHEDSCCVTIELGPEVAGVQAQLEAEFVKKAYGKVSKGARPDVVRFAPLPVSFKGVHYSQLKQEYLDWLKRRK